jgi:hypothetical protein
VFRVLRAMRKADDVTNGGGGAFVLWRQIIFNLNLARIGNVWMDGWRWVKAPFDGFA